MPWRNLCLKLQMTGRQVDQWVDRSVHKTPIVFLAILGEGSLLCLSLRFLPFFPFYYFVFRDFFFFLVRFAGPRMLHVYITIIMKPSEANF